MNLGKTAPCRDCSERFLACSDQCPKDARGEYGYHAWKAECQKAKDAEKDFKKKQREDYLMSEGCKYAKAQFARRKKGAKEWRD